MSWVWKLGWIRRAPWDKDILSRWVSLLLDTVHEYVGTDNRMLIETRKLLYRMAERCIEHGMLEDLLQIFDTMAGSRLRLGENSLLV